MTIKRKFRLQTAWICNEQASMRAYQAMPMRPYADPDSRKSKAIEYARWLAARDGIELPNTLNATVHFVPVKQNCLQVSGHLRGSRQLRERDNQDPESRL